MRASTLLILVMLVVLAGVVFLKPRPADASDAWSLVPAVRTSLDRIEEQILFQVTISQSSQRERGFPRTIDPAWFEDGRPDHPWFDETRPWVELAPRDEHGRGHPRCIVAVDPGDGAFWYDPSTGVIRARVPSGIADEEAVLLYNEANGTDVTTILP